MTVYKEPTKKQGHVALQSHAGLLIRQVQCQSLALAY